MERDCCEFIRGGLTTFQCYGIEKNRIMFNGTPLRLEKSLPQAGLEPGSAGSADKRSPLSYCGLSPEKKHFVVRNAIMSNYEILGMLLCDAHTRRLSKVLSLHILLEQGTRTFAKRLVYTR